MIQQFCFWKVKVLVALSCLTLCNPTDCSSPGSFTRGIFQARTLEWFAISFSRGSSMAERQNAETQMVLPALSQAGESMEISSSNHMCWSFSSHTMKVQFFHFILILWRLQKNFVKYCCSALIQRQSVIFNSQIFNFIHTIIYRLTECWTY